MRLLGHPLVIFAGGVLIGAVFANQVRSLPGVNKLPSK